MGEVSSWSFYSLWAQATSVSQGRSPQGTGASRQLRGTAIRSDGMGSMGRTSALVFFLVVAATGLTVTVAACAEESGQGVKTVTVAGSATAPSTTEESNTTTEEEIEANPDATYRSGCDFLLGDISQSSYGFVGTKLTGDARLHNTGNIGIVVKVVGRWNRAGSSPYRASKKVRLAVGGRKSVHLKVPVSDAEIDAIQSAQYSGAGAFCKVKASIIDTFGDPE
jgi:hypothetical protein